MFLSGREVNYPRNQLIISALQDFTQVRVIGRRKQDVSRGGAGDIVGQSLAGLLRAIPCMIMGKSDFIFVGFFGHLIMVPLRWITRKPIFFDAFISAQDTLISDRRQGRKNSLLSKCANYLDRVSCRAASLVFLDTQQHAAFFHEQFGVPTEKLQVFFVGCDETLFLPRQEHVDPNKVLFYCSYQPLHGADVVVRAARLLQGHLPVQIKLIGGGSEYSRTVALARDMGVENVEFAPGVPLEQLPDEIASSAICLGGHFGASDKASRVIPGKVFQCIAMGKAVIAGENPANRELLTHDKDAWFCKMNDPQALAEAIATLYADSDLRERLGRTAYQTFMEKAATPVLKKQIQQAITGFMDRLQV